MKIVIDVPNDESVQGAIDHFVKCTQEHYSLTFIDADGELVTIQTVDIRLEK